MIKIHDVEQGTEEWQELRRIHPFTGSGAAKVLRFGVIEYSKAITDGFKGNFYTKRGHILEDEAIELYEAIHGRQVLRPGFVTNTHCPGCGYSPDGLDCLSILQPGAILLEVKCFNVERHKAIAKGEIPVEILAQIHFGLLICNLRKARLILYNPEFAKKTIIIDGVEISNPDYDPKLALVIIEVKYNRNIQNNFKRILKGATYAPAA